MDTEAPVESTIYRLNILRMFSEIWIGNSYAALFAVKRVVTGEQLQELLHIYEPLRVLRVMIEKHQIANDNRLKAPLKLLSWPPNGDHSDHYEYSRDDARRAHIPMVGLSARGSFCWQTINSPTLPEWLERRYLSDSLLTLWKDHGKR